jgi:hypothetical protein
MSPQPARSKARPAKEKPPKSAAKREPAKAGKAKAQKANPPKVKPRTRKARPAKPEIVRRKLVWRGVLIGIQYEPGGFAYYAHLELRVIAPVGAPIPVTNTGYRSHHLHPKPVKSAGGPVAYVRKWLDHESRSPAYRRALDRWRQLDLFA